MKRLALIIPLMFIVPRAFSQDTIRVMTYNLLRYYPSDPSRDQYFRTVVRSVNPDVLVVQEIDTAAAVLNFLTNVLNAGGAGEFSAGQFIDGSFDSENALFYKTATFSFIGNQPIKTRLRDINQFTLRHDATGRVFHLFSVHLKAGNNLTPEPDSSRRSEEIDSLRARTNLFPVGTDFIVLGDFNIYGSYESAYQKLVAVGGTNEGHVVDPLVMNGLWNDPAYAPYHTQSTRVRSFGFGATGGLDDRFDMILVSKSLSESGGIWLLPGSYQAWGNDGLHYNDSINRLPNAAVPDSVAHALHAASDHLPVMARFVVETPPVSVMSVIPQSSELDLVNYPNPFNPVTEIRYRVWESGRVKISVFDILGREMEILVDEVRVPGSYAVQWNAGVLASGVYICRMSTGTSHDVRIMILLR